jgi:hypothetical protein
MVHEFLLALAVLLAVLVASCTHDACQAKGFNPATNRCQCFDGEQYGGPFLPNEDCAGQPRPVEVTPEPSAG